MKVALIQYDITWLDAAKNLAYISRKLETLAADTDLVILPEMFTTGVTILVDKASEKMDGTAVEEMKYWAQKYQIAVCGSLLIEEEGKYYNRFIFVHPDTTIEYYDKRHLFRLGGEDKVCTPGKSCPIFAYKGWRIKPQVCYDLRFPVWSRNTELYDLLIYVSNWPKARDYSYTTLLHARAIENQCYVCACNRIGVDGSRIVYDGNSLVVDAKGATLADAQDNEEILCFDLSKEDLDKFRSRFPVLDDGDGFEFR